MAHRVYPSQDLGAATQLLVRAADKWLGHRVIIEGQNEQYVTDLANAVLTGTQYSFAPRVAEVLSVYIAGQLALNPRATNRARLLEAFDSTMWLFARYVKLDPIGMAMGGLGIGDKPALKRLAVDVFNRVLSGESVDLPALIRSVTKDPVVFITAATHLRDIASRSHRGMGGH